MLVIVGHSEYWTRVARLHFDEFVEGTVRDLIRVSLHQLEEQEFSGSDGSRGLSHAENKIETTNTIETSNGVI